jgi:WD40 repeat protein/DNA-binding SARP family transcriptional activator
MTATEHRASVESLRIGVLGPLQVSSSEGTLTLPGAKEQALLAHLVVMAGRTVTTSDLIETLWGEAPPRTAGKALQNHVLRLRRLIEPDRGAPPQVLVTDPTGYRLVVPDDAIDARRFEHLVDVGRRAAREGRAGAAAATLREALGLWRGRAYPGLEATQVGSSEARRLDELRHLAELDRIAADLELSRAAEVVAELEALVAQDPLRERAWELLVLALYRSARQVDALGAYARARTVLDDEAGVEPGVGLQRLHARVLAQDPGLDLPPAAELPSGLMPGEGRLVGRDAELAGLEAEWRRVLTSGTPRTTVVRGAPGMGATRLVAELAVRVADDGAEVRLVGGTAEQPAVPAASDRPTLLVVDARRPPAGRPASVPDADGPTLTVVLAEPGQAVTGLPAGASVIDLAPLDAAGTLAVLSGYLDESAAGHALDEVLRVTGGRPARVHEHALAMARQVAGARVRGSATEVQRAQRQLSAVRDHLQQDVARSRDLADRARPLDSDACPWKGLVPYEPADAADFAGRERLVADLLARVATARLVTVAGSSGAGKSSLVAAGLVASLANGALPGSERWVTLRMRPGARPSAELVATAVRGAVPAAGDLAAALEQAVFGDATMPGRLLLVVDQVEELWTVCTDDAERQAFLGALADVIAGSSPTTVVLVCRADHVGRFAEHPTLAPLVPASTVLVGPPSASELRRAVERPAARAGLVLETGLADAIVEDAGTEPGALPLLSTALTEVWAARRGRMLTLAGYVAGGGLRGSVARVAERAFEALDEPDRRAARSLLLRLAGPGSGDAVTRRRVRLDELAGLPDARVAGVVEPLVEARLLSADDGTVEVAHEALFREWPRLRAWLEEDAATRAMHRRLTQAAHDWEAGGREASELWRGGRLVGGWDVMAGAPDEVTGLEREFLQAGRAAQQAEDRAVADRAAATTRQNRRLRWLLGGLGLLLVAALVAGGLAVRSSEMAQAARGEAETSAQVATARELAAASVAAVPSDPELAVLLAREAVAATEDPLPEAVEALHTAVVSSRVVATWTEPGAGGAVDWSPDGTVVVTEGPEASGLVQLRDPTTGEVVRQWVGHDVDLNDVVIGADGTLATAGDDGAAVAWDASTGAQLARTQTPDGGAFTPTLSANGSLLAASFSAPGVIGLVDVGSGEQWTVKRPGWIGWPALNPAGTELAVGRWDDGPGVVEVVHPRTGARQRTMDGRFDHYIGALAWSPDGRWIAVVGDDEVRVWDAATGALTHTFPGHSRFTVRLDWSSDSSRVASASHDGTARVWPVTSGGTPLVLTSAAIAPGLLGVAFDDTGTRVLAGNFAVDQAVVFDVSAAGSREWATVAVPDEPVTVQFTGDGRTLVTAGESGGAALVDASTGEPTGAAALARGPLVGRVALSPDGTLLAESGSDVVRTVSVVDGAVVAERALDPDTPRPIAWHPDGDMLAVTGYGAGATYLADTRGSVVRSVLEQDGFAATGVAISPDGTRMATSRNPMGANVNEWGVTIWDWQTGARVAESDVHGEALAFSPDGRTLLVGSPSGEAVLLDAATGRTRQTLSGHLGGVLAVAYSADGSRLATGDGEGRLRLWDAAGSLLGALPGHGAFVTGLAFSPDGSRLASAGFDGVARVWALDLDDLRAIADTKVTRDLTSAECSRYLRRSDC